MVEKSKLHSRYKKANTEYNMKSVYEDLMIDIVMNCNTNMFEARKVINYLRDQGILDYDILKEYYDQNEEID
jgi:hypothetical protein